MDLTNQRKLDIGSKLYIWLSIPIIAILMLDTTSIYWVDNRIYRIVSYAVLVMSCVLLLLKTILFDVLINTRARLILSICALLAVYHGMLLIGALDFYIVLIMCLGAHGVNARKILTVYCLESAAIVVITTFAAVIGIIPNLVYTQYGIKRYSLGNTYCTDYAARIFFLVLIFLYIYCRKIRPIHLICLFILATGVFAATFAKLDYICMVLTLIIFAFHLYVEKHKDNRFSRIWYSWWPKIGMVAMPAAAIVMFILTVLYSGNHGFLGFVDRVLSGRLALGKNGFSEFGVPVLGQQVTYIGFGGSDGDVIGYNFVDCSYLHMLFREGAILTPLVIAAYAFIARRCRKNMFVMYIVTMISLNCMVSHHLIEFSYNPFLILLLADQDERLEALEQESTKSEG